MSKPEKDTTKQITQLTFIFHQDIILHYFHINANRYLKKQIEGLVKTSFIYTLSNNLIRNINAMAPDTTSHLCLLHKDIDEVDLQRRTLNYEAI